MCNVFIDTNVLVYSLDAEDLEKQRQARDLLKKLSMHYAPVISTQVLKEFYVVAVKKMKVAPGAAKEMVGNFRNMRIVNNDIDLIVQAIDISILYKVSFWDSLILAAAEQAGCKYLLSEGLNSGQVYRGVLVVNPFQEDITFHR